MTKIEQMTLAELRRTVQNVANYSGLYISKNGAKKIADLYAREKTIIFKHYPMFCKEAMLLFLELLHTEKPSWNLVKYKERLLAEKYGSRDKTTITDLIKEVNDVFNDNN